MWIVGVICAGMLTPHKETILEFNKLTDWVGDLTKSVQEETELCFPLE